MFNTQAITRLAGKIRGTLRQQAPNILFGMGIASGVAATIFAIKETPATEVFDEHNDNMYKINAVAADPDEYDAPEYDDVAYKRDVFLEHVDFAKNLAKAYAPAIGLGTLSLVCLISSHTILIRREKEATAAYSALAALFGKYRTKVQDQIGVEKEQKLLAEAKHEPNPADSDDEKLLPAPTPVAFYYGPYFLDPQGNKICKNMAWDPNDNERNRLALEYYEKAAYERNENEGHLRLDTLLFHWLGCPDVSEWDYIHKLQWSKKLNDQSTVDLGFRNDPDFMNDRRGDDGELTGVWLFPNCDGLITKGSY